MNTTELIELLEKVEFGASNRPREISFYFGESFFGDPDIKISSTGDGCAGAELCLQITPRPDHYNEVRELSIALENLKAEIIKAAAPILKWVTEMFLKILIKIRKKSK